MVKIFINNSLKKTEFYRNPAVLLFRQGADEEFW